MLNRPSVPQTGFRCDDVWVSFGATRALAGVSLAVAPGQVVGLMGHNGAGKSTLLNVATGAMRPDRGAIRVGDRQAARFGDPRYFADLGVTVIHQEPALAPNLSIFDNLIVARSSGRNRAKTRRRAAEVMSALGLAHDLDLPVSVLSLGERQMVDLARGMMTGHIDALLLDEPAAALGAEETAVLHDRIRWFTSQGTAVVYVSHRLPDILDICDRIVVLREGRVVMDQERKGFTSKTLAVALAPESAQQEARSRVAVGPELLTIRRGDKEMRFRRGEIVGLFGVAGGSQFEVLDSLFQGGPGVEATLSGHVYRPTGPADAISSGVYLVPGDRERDGLVPGMSAIDNVFLPWNSQLTSGGRLRSSKMRKKYAEIRGELGIRGPDGDAPIASFSGGNRQKHLLARWVSVRKPELLLLAQPTQGVDEAAKADIRRVVRGVAESGVAVVVASAESDELSSLCDRVYVLAVDGVHEVEASEDFDEELLSLISGERA